MSCETVHGRHAIYQALATEHCCRTWLLYFRLIGGATEVTFSPVGISGRLQEISDPKSTKITLKINYEIFDTVMCQKLCDTVMCRLCRVT